MMSRETRIILLLVIDVLFFFVELIVGAWFPLPASPNISETDAEWSAARICGRLPRARGGQFPHAQVRS